MKKLVYTFAIVLLAVTSLSAQQRNAKNQSNNRAAVGTGATRSNGNSPTASNNGTNSNAGLNTTTDQNYGAGSAAGPAGVGGNMPTSTDTRSSTLTTAPPVKAKKNSAETRQSPVIQVNPLRIEQLQINALVMKTIIGITLIALLPALAFAQRESIKSSSKYNSAAMRVSDKEKQKAMGEKFNGQKPDMPAKPKPQAGKQPVQGPTENGGRVKNPKINNGNS